MIISSVLLILLVLVLSVIIISFVVPFVENQLSGGDCLSAFGNVEIVNGNKYTCYSGNEMSVQVRINEDENIAGFSIVFGGASTKAYEIKVGTTNSEIKMFGGVYNELLEIPGENEERTYVFKSDDIPEIVNLFPILKDGRICDSASNINRVVSCAS